MAKKILVVDDSKTFRQQISITLERKGYNPIEADDGIEGLEMLDEHDICIVICDVNMPRMDGITMIEEVKKRAKYQGPIIMLTTEGGRETIEKGRQLGISCWMVKPFDPTTLLVAVEKLTADA